MLAQHCTVILGCVKKHHQVFEIQKNDNDNYDTLFTKKNDNAFHMCIKNL